MIMAMLKDIALWALVSIVFTCAFAVAFLATSHGADGGPWEVATMPIWAMLGNYDVDEVSAWSPSVGNAMLWIFIVVSNILLVNLLIAMMGDTYSDAQKRSIVEYRCFFAQKILYYELLVQSIVPYARLFAGKLDPETGVYFEEFKKIMRSKRTE